MTFERITLVIDQPVGKDDDGVSPGSLRESMKCDQFANELQARTRARVTVVEQYPQIVLSTEFVLLYTGPISEIDPAFLKKFAKRIIVMDSGATEGFEVLYKYGLAGAVALRLYLFWRRGNDDAITPGFLGLTKVAKEINAEIFREIGEGDYCDMYDPSASGLPKFLIRYLEAYSKSLS